MPIILVIDGHRYDVTEFDHPGEGINGIYLKDFHNKTVDKEMNHYHNTDEPWEMLEEARMTGECDGIKYLGPVEK